MVTPIPIKFNALPESEAEPAVDRFWSKVTVAGANSCWEWQACKSTGGYGRFFVAGLTRYAHRVAYEIVRGPIPDGLHIDHLCSNRSCVNPLHMEPVTKGENTRRGWRTNGGRAKAQRRLTHCKHGHPFTPENTRIGRNGWRLCIECSRRHSRQAGARYRQRNQAAEQSA